MILLDIFLVLAGGYVAGEPPRSSGYRRGVYDENMHALDAVMRPRNADRVGVYLA